MTPKEFEVTKNLIVLMDGRTWHPPTEFQPAGMYGYKTTDKAKEVALRVLEYFKTYDLDRPPEQNNRGGIFFFWSLTTVNRTYNSLLSIEVDSEGTVRLIHSVIARITNDAKYDGMKDYSPLETLLEEAEQLFQDSFMITR